MGIRESINKNQTVAAVIAAVFLMLLVGLIAWQLLYSGPSPVAAGGVDRRFFTIDDGKTYFADEARKYPPFEKDGKQAVQAMVFKDMDTGAVFVGYLVRYTPAAKKILEDADKGGGQRRLPAETVVDHEIKKPLAGEWVKSGDAAAGEILNIMSPSGGTNVEPVMP